MYNLALQVSEHNQNPLKHRKKTLYDEKKESMIESRVVLVYFLTFYLKISVFFQF